MQLHGGSFAVVGSSFMGNEISSWRSFLAGNFIGDGPSFMVSAVLVARTAIGMDEILWRMPPHVKLYLESQLLDEGSRIVGPRRGLPQVHGECVEASSWFLHRAASWMAASLWQCSLMVIMLSGRVSAPGFCSCIVETSSGTAAGSW